MPYRKNEAGQPLCRWCGIIVHPPKRTWCSKECVDEFLVRNNAGSLRSATFKRDKGFCAKCGCDTEKMKRILMSGLHSYYRLMDGCCTGTQNYRDYAGFCRSIGLRLNATLWEADHILEVVNDGDGGLDNIQTLCLPCHKSKTRVLAAERARLRRLAA